MVPFLTDAMLSRRYYIQSAYRMKSDEKIRQERASLLRNHNHQHLRLLAEGKFAGTLRCGGIRKDCMQNDQICFFEEKIKYIVN